jgi:hypothetical protein
VNPLIHPGFFLHRAVGGSGGGAPLGVTLFYGKLFFFQGDVVTDAVLNRLQKGWRSGLIALRCE